MKRYSNPFPSGPCAPDLFINREEILNNFINAVGTSLANFDSKQCMPVNYLIVGDWGLGKSSVISKLIDVLVSEFKDEKIHVAYLHLSDTVDEKKLLESILDPLESSKTLSLLRRIKKMDLTVFGALGGGVELKPDNTEIEFKYKISKIWKKVNKSSDLIILFIDDFQYVGELVLKFRNIFQDVQQKCNIMIVAASLPELLIGQYTEPLQRLFQYKKALEPFDLNYTKQAIQSPLSKSKLNLSVSDDVCGELHKMTQGHPSIINKLMFRLVNIAQQNKITNLNLDSFKKYRRELTEVIREQLEHVLEDCSKTDIETLRTISKWRKASFSPKEIKIETAYLKPLIAKGLVKRIRYGEYRLTNPMIREYFK